MYKNILITTDGSELATQGLSHGLELAKKLNIPVTIMTATETWPMFAMVNQAEKHIANPIEQFEKGVAAAAQKILSAAEETAKKLGVACECIHVKDRHPAEGILETATSKGCDLIVMASHGRRGMKKVLLGSVASEVLTHSKVPVLILR